MCAQNTTISDLKHAINCTYFGNSCGSGKKELQVAFINTKVDIPV